MSWEEDYLMAKVKELEVRLAEVEKGLGASPLPSVVPGRADSDEALSGSQAPGAAQEPAEPVYEDVYEDEYSLWAFADLRTEAKRRGLSAGGSATELAERLREDDRETL